MMDDRLDNMALLNNAFETIARSDYEQERLENVITQARADLSRIEREHRQATQDAAHLLSNEDAAGVKYIWTDTERRLWLVHLTKDGLSFERINLIRTT